MDVKGIEKKLAESMPLPFKLPLTGVMEKKSGGLSRKSSKSSLSTSVRLDSPREMNKPEKEGERETEKAGKCNPDTAISCVASRRPLCLSFLPEQKRLNPLETVSLIQCVFGGSFEVLNFTLEGPGADIVQMKVDVS